MRLLEFLLVHLYRKKLFPLDLSYFEEAITQYSSLDARSKTVIDVGADWGTTPLVWAAQGAKKVIAFEADEKRRKRMQRFLGRFPWLEIHEAWNGQHPTGDIIKIDCDGCERGIDPHDLLAFYSEVLVVHHVHDVRYEGSATKEREIRTEYLKRSPALTPA